MRLLAFDALTGGLALSGAAIVLFALGAMRAGAECARIVALVLLSLFLILGLLASIGSAFAGQGFAATRSALTLALLVLVIARIRSMPRA